MAAVTSRPTNPMAPIYLTIERYPSGPLPEFPPSAPQLHNRRSHLSRPGVNMRIQITRTPSALPAGHAPSPWSAKGHIQPHRNHLPRRRNPRRIVQYEHIVDSPEEPEALALPEVTDGAETELDPDVEALYRPDVPVNDPSLQNIFDGLWVAFAEGTERIKDLPHDGGVPYTHVVTIVQGDLDGSSEQHCEGGVQRLRLVLPGSARAQRARKALALTDAQLRVARDFIIRALPTDHDPNTRLLITTPFGRPTDAMCVAVCHLKATLGKDLQDIVDAIEDDDDMYSIWKGEISEDEFEKIEQVAQTSC